MSDIASLIIRVTTEGVAQAESGLSGLTKKAMGAAGAMAALATAGKALSTMVDVQLKMDVLNASLITMTKSAEDAGTAMGILQQFAKDTPYGLEQAVEAFTKLSALGLTPSQEALTSYGNTAAAMGKDLMQMIEAVADATTFEFERLKEFGIKTQQEGNKVKFTFQGVTTEVGKNAKEIEQYLLNIGNVQFAGAMEERSKTLDGAIASLEDTWLGFVNEINTSSGFGEVAASAVREVEEAITSLTDLVASGEFVSDIQNWATTVDESFRFISDFLNDLTGQFARDSDDINTSTASVADEIRDWMPTIQETVNNALAYFRRMDNYAKALGKSIRAAFTPGKDAGDAFDEGMKAAEAQYQAELKYNAGVAQSIRAGNKTRQQAIQLQKDLYAAEKEAQRNRKLEDTARFKPGDSAPDTSDEDKKKQKAAEKAAKERERMEKEAQNFLDQLARSNQVDRMAAIDADEQQRLKKLQEYREKDLISATEFEKAKTQIIAEANKDRDEEREKQRKKEEEEKKKQQAAEAYLQQMLAGGGEGMFSEFDELDRQNEIKLEKLQEFYDQGLYLEEQYQAGINAINEQYSLGRAKATANVFGNMADSIGASLGEASAAYKAFAIAQATIATYTSAIEAYKSASAIPIVGWVLGPVAAAAAIAAGVANISKIRSAREQGGMLAAGQASTIAERGKFEVIAPASASRVRTAEQMRQIMGENGGKNSGGDNVMIINNTTGRIDSSRTERDDEGRLRILIEEHVASSLQDSNSRISKARRTTRGEPGFV